MAPCSEGLLELLIALSALTGRVSAISRKKDVIMLLNVIAIYHMRYKDKSKL